MEILQLFNYDQSPLLQLIGEVSTFIRLWNMENERGRCKKARYILIYLHEENRKDSMAVCISNEDLMKRTEIKRVSTEVKTRRWKWIGHVLRMERNGHCRTALTWQPEGKRRRGRPRTTWRRTVEHERKEMVTASWEIARNMALHRTGWRRRILASCA